MKADRKILQRVAGQPIIWNESCKELVPFVIIQYTEKNMRARKKADLASAVRGEVECERNAPIPQLIIP